MIPFQPREKKIMIPRFCILSFSISCCLPLKECSFQLFLGYSHPIPPPWRVHILLDRLSNWKKRALTFSFSFSPFFLFLVYFSFEALSLDFTIHEFCRFGYWFWRLIYKFFIPFFFFTFWRSIYIFGLFFCTFLTLFVKYSPFWHLLFFVHLQACQT